MDTITAKENKESVEPRDYEIALLLAREELLPNILNILHQYKIEIESEGSAKKIKLAYDIAKAKEAYFIFLRVAALPDDIKLLEANLKSDPRILRSLVIRLFSTKVERDDASKRADRSPFRPSARRFPGAAFSAAADSRQPSTLSNEALEKKIEEILQ